MSPLKIAALCVLAAYLLVVSFNFVTKLHGVRLAQKLRCLLFPLSQFLLIAFPLACSARYELPVGAYAALVVLGIACGLVDVLLFRALNQACRWFDSSDKVRALQDQVQAQGALQKRAAAERKQADALRCQLRGQLEQARESLRARQAGDAGKSLEGAICLIGVRPQRFCWHPAVDALLAQKANMARNLNIRFHTELDVPADVDLPSVELCAVFSNLLDNALNACAPLAPPDRSVEVTARSWGRYLIVDVENSCPPASGASRGLSARRNRGVAAGKAPDAERAGRDRAVGVLPAEQVVRSADSEGRAAVAGAAAADPAAARRGGAAGCVRVLPDDEVLLGAGSEGLIAGAAGDGASAAVGGKETEASGALPGGLPDLSVPHGWGQGIVREIAHRHDGSFEASRTDGAYRVRVIMKQDGGDDEWIS